MARVNHGRRGTCTSKSDVNDGGGVKVVVAVVVEATLTVTTTSVRQPLQHRQHPRAVYIQEYYRMYLFMTSRCLRRCRS